MLRFWLISIAVAGAPAIAFANSLIEARDAEDVAKAMTAAPGDAARIYEAAEALGVADPVDVVFAALSPGDAIDRIASVIGPIIEASPRAADEAAGAAALAADLITRPETLPVLAERAIQSVYSTPIPTAAKREEAVEILTALLTIAPPEFRDRIAQAAADTIALLTGIDVAAADLLSEIGGSVETGAVATVGSRGVFREAAPVRLILTPDSAAQDAPSAN
ncbi:MAG: hypothetical protein AAF401_00105 [Pseudomonadota bacterium]